MNKMKIMLAALLCSTAVMAEEPKGLDKILITFADNVTALIVVIWLCQDQIFRDFAELRIRIEPDALLFFFRIHDKVRHRHKCSCHKVRNTGAEMRIDTVRHQFPTQIAARRDILHRGCGHRFIIVIDLGHQTRCKFALKFEYGGFNFIAIEIQRPPGRAQQAVSLLDDHGTSVPKGTDLKNIVDIAVADFPTFQCFIRGKEMEHFNGIAFDIFRIHKEEGMKVTHGNLLAACKYYDSIHCGIRRTHIKLYTKNGQKSTLNQKSGQVGKKEEFDGMTSNDI